MRTLCAFLLSIAASGCGPMGPVGGISGVMRSDEYETETGVGFSVGVREQGNNAEKDEVVGETFHDAFPRVDFSVEFYPRGEQEVTIVRQGRSYTYGTRTLTATADQRVSGFGFRLIPSLRYTLLGRQSSSYATRLDIGVLADWETVLVTNDLEWRVDDNEVFQVGTPAFNDNALRVGALIGWNLRYRFLNIRIEGGATQVASTGDHADRDIGDLGGYVASFFMVGY